MFSLIISIISIALVAALAAATVYFGGAAFNKGSAGADASTFINAGQQVAGAFTLASADGYTVPTVAGLNNGTTTKGEIYLAQIPSYKGDAINGFVTGNANYVAVGVSDLVCAEIVKRAAGPDEVVGTPAVFAPTTLFGCQAVSADVATTTDGTANPETLKDFVAFYKVK
jgi:hypothetical protein